jgi:hypothetical protein
MEEHISHALLPILAQEMEEVWLQEQGSQSKIQSLFNSIQLVFMGLAA